MSREKSFTKRTSTPPPSRNGGICHDRSGQRSPHLRTLDRERLSAKASSAIESAERILVSSISIWEIGVKVKREKLLLPVSLRDYTERLKSVAKVELVPVDDDLWIRSLELNWEHRDPADRLIVATASRLACRLLTSDKTLLNYYAEGPW